MNVIDLPALRRAAQTILTWSDHPTPRNDPDWPALADAIHTLRGAASHGRLQRIITTLTEEDRPSALDDALRDLADLTALPRPPHLERRDQLRLPL